MFKQKIFVEKYSHIVYKDTNYICFGGWYGGTFKSMGRGEHHKADGESGVEEPDDISGGKDASGQSYNGEALDKRS